VSYIDAAEYEVGFGVTARFAGRKVRVGSRRFLEYYGLDIPGSLAGAERDAYVQGASLVYVSRDDDVIGLIELAPNLRPEVPEVLGARGCELHLISGDHEAPTRAFAEALGFDRWSAGVLPEGKARIVEELAAAGRTVCFVGDGINDAIALKKAAVSVSLGGASTAATNSAQIVLLREGLDRLPAALEIGDSYDQELRRLVLALGVPEVLAIGGVFFGGLRVAGVTALYGAAMAVSAAVTMGRSRAKRARTISRSSRVS
jgi:P-type E1-E2 ATPase